MKNYFVSMTISVVSIAITSTGALAQTIFDPTPSIGNGAEAAAATMGIKFHLNPSNRPSAAEFARREAHGKQWDAHGKQWEACRDRSRQYEVSDPRRDTVRAECDRTLEEQKATWYDPRMQAH